MGGRLAVVDSRETGEWLIQQIKAGSSINDTHFWIGAEFQKPSVWTWMNGVENNGKQKCKVNVFYPMYG